MSLNKANFLKTLGAATVIILGTQSCNLHKNLTGGWNYNDSKEKQEKVENQQNTAYGKLIRRLSKEYGESHDGGRYHGKDTVGWIEQGQGWRSNDIVGEQRFFLSKGGDTVASHIYGREKDFYTDKYYSIGGGKGDTVINHIASYGNFFRNREMFYQQIVGGAGMGVYGVIVKDMAENTYKAYKIYDTIEVKDFEEIIRKTEHSPLIRSQDEYVFKAQYGEEFRKHLISCSTEEKMLWLLPEYYYDKIKGHQFETYGTLLDKPSDHIMKFADKHGFVLKPKILVLRNIESYDTKYKNNSPIELQGIYIWLPEKKVQDTIPQVTKEQIQETEKQMNEIFEYGQKAIFKSNLSEFSNETVKEGLDKLYDMLEKNPSLKIKVTGYYGGLNSTLPGERAEKVKKYLVKKGISSERITTQGGKEQIAKSIKIEIIK